jgi:hypothetical protein
MTIPTSTADRYRILMLCKASDMVWSARMVAKCTQFMAMGEVTDDRSAERRGGGMFGLPDNTIEK